MIASEWKWPLKRNGKVVWQGSPVRVFRPADVPATKPLPTVVSIHYQAPDWLIQRVLDAGWCMVTPFDVPEEAVQDFVGHDLEWCPAMVARVFELPGVDGKRVGLVGASAGGFQALHAAPHFPSLAGVCNFAGAANVVYNILFWIANEHREPVSAERQAPTLAEMRQTFRATEQSLLRHGRGRLDAPENRKLLPFDALADARCPFLHVHSTADRLVPVYEVTEDMEPPHPAWPDTTVWRGEDVVPEPACRGTLADALPDGAAVMLRDAFTDEAGAVRSEFLSGTVDGRALLNLPFSRDKQHTIVLVDEGPPLHPKAGHTLHSFFPDVIPFFKWCFSQV